MKWPPALGLALLPAAVVLLAGPAWVWGQVPLPRPAYVIVRPPTLSTNPVPAELGQPLGPAQPIQPVQPRAVTAPLTVAPRPFNPNEVLPPATATRAPVPEMQASSARQLARQTLENPGPGYRPPAIEAIMNEPITGTNAGAAARAEEGPAVYYVDPAGADDHTGHHNQPWRTLQKAADTVKAGDRVIVNPGRYDGFELRTSGTGDHPILFRAAVTGEAIIASPNKKTPDDINIEGASFVVIDGFTVKEGKRAGIRVVEAAGVVVQNNVVGPNERWGIFTGFTPGLKLLHNQTFGSRIEHGIYVSNSRVPADQPVVSYNECYQNGQNGIQFNGDCTMGGDGVIQQALIEGNIVHDNGWKGLSLISIQQSTIQNNLIYGNGRRGIGAGGIHLTDQLGCGKPSSDNLVVNNTVIEPRIAALRITDGAQRNVVFNNILLSRVPLADEVSGNRIDTDSNLLGNPGDRLFRDSGAGDFRLSASSTARGRGLGDYGGRQAPTQDLEGHARMKTSSSLGAFE